MHKRALPWRESRDPYRIWISEVMLQQTRVAAALPYYERFLAQFPDVETLASAPEAKLLAAWAGLGYYSRARNLQKAAREIAAAGRFPETYEGIRALAGVGDYTAAAVSSLALNLPHAVLDGNVLRVLSRVCAEAGEIRSATVRRRLGAAAQALLDPKHPGDFNQAIMELGATVCRPRDPHCARCPISAFCRARQTERQSEFPVKRPKRETREIRRRLLLIQRGSTVLLWQRPADSQRLAGFWELPEAEQLPAARLGTEAGRFSHTIVNTRFRFEVFRASLESVPAGFVWMDPAQRDVPFSTTARKALGCAMRGKG